MLILKLERSALLYKWASQRNEVSKKQEGLNDD